MAGIDGDGDDDDDMMKKALALNIHNLHGIMKY